MYLCLCDAYVSLYVCVVWVMYTCTHMGYYLDDTYRCMVVDITQYICIYNWLVVSTPLKNISQLGVLFPIYGKIKNVPNHQPDTIHSTFNTYTITFDKRQGIYDDMIYRTRYCMYIAGQWFQQIQSASPNCFRTVRPLFSGKTSAIRMPWLCAGVWRLFTSPSYISCSM